MNIFAEPDGSGTGRATMYKVPGLQLYCTLPTLPVKGMIETNYRTFVVSGGQFYEVYDDKTFSASRGSVGLGSSVSMASNWRQIVIISDHIGFLFDLQTNTLSTLLGTPGFPALCTNVTCIDGYFVVGNFNSRQFSISVVNDGATWVDGSGLPMFAQKEGASDNIVAVLATRRTLVIFGFETTEVWWDAGSASFPFQPVQGALLEQGLAAVNAPLVADDGVYWLGSDGRGNCQVWGEVNLSPMRISTFAIENLLSGLSSIDDATGMVYQERGHTFLLWHFQEADVTICYDKTVGLWHKRGSWDVALGVYHYAKARYHTFSFVPIQHSNPTPGVQTDGVHLVGEANTGNLYIQSMDYQDDNGDPIRWLRRAPNVIVLNKRNSFRRLELLCQVGTVPQAPAAGSNPIATLRYSDDGGYTWSNEKPAYMGKTGKYKNRVIWRQLGAGRDRVFEVSGMDPIPIALVDAFVRLEQGDE